MQLTPTTFSNLDENLELRQLAAVQAANGTRFGRLPNTEFCADGVFVQGNFEIQEFKCIALLPSGCLISPEEPVSVRFPRVSDGWAYLTVSLGTDMLEYEKEGVPYVRQSYKYEILTQAEMIRQHDVMPVVRFRIEGGRCNIDQNFIPPCMMIVSDSRLTEWRDTIKELLKQIAGHKNMQDGDCKQTMLRYLSRLSTFSLRHSVESLMLLTGEIAQAVGYYIVTANGVEDNQPDESVGFFDIEMWLEHIKNYLNDAIRILDGVELVDSKIDYEALKAELKAEIYEMIKPEMKEYVDTSMQTLRDDLNQRLSDALREYIDGTFRRQLEETLKVTISNELNAELYDKLYRALYDALFVPQTDDEDSFMPLI